MLVKESKIRILENFYGLDYVFFGKPIKQVPVCCPAFVAEYVSIKGALLSTLVEMYKLIGHKPAAISSQKVTKKMLQEFSKKSAISARENSKKLIKSKKGLRDVRVAVQEVITKNKNKKKRLNIDKLTESKIKEKAFSLAVDNLLVARALRESKNVSKLNEWDGKIIEDAYKVLRESLVECAIDILENGV
jgi:hypothetical protein